MPTKANPSTDFRLTLEPWFPSAGWVVQFVIVALVLGLTLWLVWRLYRTELRLTEGWLARTLLVLRLCVVAAVILLMSLRPTLRYTATEPVPSVVLIAIDRSSSMNVADPQRPALEKVELAISLGQASDIASETELESWRKSLATGQDVPSGFASAFKSMCARIDALTRSQIADAILRAKKVGLAPNLREKHALRIVGFHQQLVELHNETIPLLETAARGAELTDLNLPLAAGAEADSQSSGPLLGIVLLTDGRHNAGASPVERGVELGRRGIPIYPVRIGSPVPPNDVAIAAVQGTSTVFQNTDALIEATVLVNYLPAGPMKVALTWPEIAGSKQREPLIETVQHDGATRLYSVRFQARMDRAGVETVTITATIDPKQGADRFPENNRRSFTVRVAPDKAKVLLVDGEARWEHHYLAAALARDPTMEVRSVLFEQPRIGAQTEEALRDLKHPERNLPPEPEALFGFDCIVLGDVSPDRLSLVERERIERYVGERGGTLVIVAGKTSMPLEFLRRAPDAERPDPIVKLLPIRDPRIVTPAKGLPLTLTAEGRQTPFLKLEADAVESADRWSKLPPHFWAIAGRAKDGASTLASFTDDSINETVGERERAHAVIVRHHYGFGRVIYMGIDSTWRWRFKTGDLYHHRFWGQLVRWAASDRPLVSGNETVRFGAREPVYRTGDEVELLLRIGEGVRPLAADALSGMRIIRMDEGKKEEVVARLPLKPQSTSTREWSAQVRDLAPGNYAVEPVIPELEGRLLGTDGRPLRSEFRVTEPESGERVDLSTNTELLEELAVKSGGKMFPAERASELLELLASRSAVKVVPVAIPLGHSGWTLWLLISLLTLEWILRKKAGLV